MNMSTPLERIRQKVRIVPDSESGFQSVDDVVSMIRRLYSRHALVPVICEDMYEYMNPETGERQSLHSYMVESVISRCGMDLEMTESELEDIVKEGYYGMSLLAAKIGKDIYQALFNAVVDEDNRLYAGICLKKEVSDFLKACKFPLIVTTNCFPILEKELGADYRSYWCELETKNDSPLAGKCIYHLFGEAKPENSNWGYNDKQLLRFLRSAYSDYPLKNLTSVICSNAARQTLLILGNDAPDWLFRFILTPIYGGDVYDDGKGFYMNDDSSRENGGLNQFLRDIKFEKESQLVDILGRVTSRIGNSENPQPGNHGKRYDFFVAHAGDDSDKVAKLVEILRRNGLSVWVDYENIRDGRYWQRIVDSLKDSAFFMPFITEKYIMKTAPARRQRAVMDELGLKTVTMDYDECRELNAYLDGIQVELMLANRWLELNPSDVYSVPVLLSGSEVFDEPLTVTRVENWSRDSKRLPKELFWGIQMYDFDESTPDSFVMDWNRYK